MFNATLRQEGRVMTGKFMKHKYCVYLAPCFAIYMESGTWKVVQSNTTPNTAAIKITLKLNNFHLVSVSIKQYQPNTYFETVFWKVCVAFHVYISRFFFQDSMIV